MNTTIGSHVRYSFRSLATLGLVVLLAAVGTWFIATSARSATENSEINLLASGWDYLPGADVQPDGVHIQHLGRAIVRQNGTSGQPNPPVNLYGTHLNIEGDFVLNATLKDIKGTASLQFYADAPIVQDEFRIEPKSIRLSISNQTLSVATWNGYSNQDVYRQTPAVKQYKFKPQANNTIALQRQNGRLDIAINNKHIATFSNDKTFSSNTVWFGANAENAGDSWTLAGLTAKPLSAGAVTAFSTQALPEVSKDSQGLQQLATQKRPGFLVGAAMALTPAVADQMYRSIAYSGHFGSMTTENVLKWQFVHPQPQTYDFDGADALITLANKSGFAAVNGHTLVFGEANPKWVQDLPTTTPTDKQRVREIMLDHITKTVDHFKGRIASWDVINEPLADYGDAANADGLRQHKWYNAMGENYIAAALTTARQADPNAKLYINEFGLEADGARWNNFVALLTKLKANSVPIDGVGFQAHVYEKDDVINPEVLRAHIRQLAQLGITARISEMDVYTGDGTAVQAQQYADVFNACISEPNCVSWTTWGITDKYNLWLTDDNRVQTGHDFLWTDTYEPTNALTMMQKILTN